MSREEIKDAKIVTTAEKLAILRQHYALNGAGNHAAARELLTDDFVITIPSFHAVRRHLPRKRCFSRADPAREAGG